MFLRPGSRWLPNQMGIGSGVAPDDGSRIQLDIFKSEVAFSEAFVDAIQLDIFKSEVAFSEAFVDAIQVDGFKSEVCFLEV